MQGKAGGSGVIRYTLYMCTYAFLAAGGSVARRLPRLHCNVGCRTAGKRVWRRVTACQIGVAGRSMQCSVIYIYMCVCVCAYIYITVFLVPCSPGLGEPGRSRGVFRDGSL